MHQRLTIFLLTLITTISVLAHPSDFKKNQAHYLTTITEKTPPPSLKTDQTPDQKDGTRVVVLGYHDFSTTKKATEMIIPTEKFRKQMQAIKDLKLPVISMDDFLAWRKGEKKIEDKSILITIDDGWKSVYTDAYPILKEFGYPFTVFLYTNYVDGGGGALTTPMLVEMQKHGCTIGSHSISHPYPRKIRREKKKGAKKFTQFLLQEMGKSKKTLEKKFKQPVRTYAYPGGFVTEEMFPVAEKLKYECLFTVLPRKVTLASNNLTLPRYVILGTHDYIFRNATTFKATENSAAIQGAVVQTVPHPVSPKPGELTSNRRPTITADLSKIKNLDPESLIMRVAGFGKVPATFNDLTKIVTWQPNRRLRSSTCEVSMQWKLLESTKYEKAMEWTFKINKEAAYQPSPIITPSDK